MELTKQNLNINFVDFQFPCGSKLFKFCHVCFIQFFMYVVEKTFLKQQSVVR